MRLPPKQKAEQWPGGPDLAPLALKPAGVGGGQSTPYLDDLYVTTANQATFAEDVDAMTVGSAAIYLRSGRLLEFINLESEAKASMQPSDVREIARAAANYVNAAGPGS